MLLLDIVYYMHGRKSARKKGCLQNDVIFLWCTIKNSLHESIADI
jgi:hypothetical protein